VIAPLCLILSIVWEYAGAAKNAQARAATTAFTVRCIL
jgi:hypothetical protein